MKKIITALATAALSGIVLVENRRLAVTEYSLCFEKLPKGFDNKKLLLLSDLHGKRYGENYSNLLDSCRVLNADYIFFAGDLYSRKDTDFQPKLWLLNELSKIAPTYYVAGNHEIHYPNNFEEFSQKLKGTGAVFLKNQKAVLKSEGDEIDVYGSFLPLKFYKNKDGSYKNLPVPDGDYLRKILGEPDKNRFSVLVSHNPFFLDSYEDWGADLVLSGHCHGGIVRLPLVGGILSPERKFFPKYTKGIYTKGDTVMALSAGLGKFRINNPAEITVINLSCKRSDDDA